MRAALPPRFHIAQRPPVTSHRLLVVLLVLGLLALVVVAVGLAIGASVPVESELLAPFRWPSGSPA